MKQISILISPRARSAYFGDTLTVARAELAWCTGLHEITHTRTGEMDFFNVSVDEALIPKLARLSCVHGLFENTGSLLRPLPVETDFHLHEDFVFGTKFRGKTSEILTQMLINVGLTPVNQSMGTEAVKILDPMCGRATTLLWALRYGLKSKGIEQDPKALADIRQSIKKWCKIHRQKHQLSDGFIGAKSKHQTGGKFIDFSIKNRSMRVITGDSSMACNLLNDEKFHLLISDLPYGIQHHTTRKTRNPLTVITYCADGWIASMKPGGILVLAFNAYQPKRNELLDVFTSRNMIDLAFSAPHRVSESILRDVVVLRKQPTKP